MKIAITYAELQDYVASHFHKTVNLGYVDGATISVSVPIKVLGFTKSVSINITVKKIEGIWGTERSVNESVGRKMSERFVYQ